MTIATVDSIERDCVTGGDGEFGGVSTRPLLVATFSSHVEVTPLLWCHVECLRDPRFLSGSLKGHNRWGDRSEGNNGNGKNQTKRGREKKKTVE